MMRALMAMKADLLARNRDKAWRHLSPKAAGALCKLLEFCAFEESLLVRFVDLGKALPQDGNRNTYLDELVEAGFLSRSTDERGPKARPDYTVVRFPAGIAANSNAEQAEGETASARSSARNLGGESARNRCPKTIDLFETAELAQSVRLNSSLGTTKQENNTPLPGGTRARTREGQSEKTPKQLQLSADRKLARKLFSAAAEEHKVVSELDDGMPASLVSKARKLRKLRKLDGQALDPFMAEVVEGVCTLVAAGKALKWAIRDWEPGHVAQRGFSPGRTSERKPAKCANFDDVTRESSDADFRRQLDLERQREADREAWDVLDDEDYREVANG